NLHSFPDRRSSDLPNSDPIIRVIPQGRNDDIGGKYFLILIENVHLVIVGKIDLCSIVSLYGIGFGFIIEDLDVITIVNPVHIMVLPPYYEQIYFLIPDPEHFKNIVIIQTVKPDLFCILRIVNSVIYNIGFFTIFYSENANSGLPLRHSFYLYKVILVGTRNNGCLSKVFEIPICDLYNVISSSL